MLYTKNYVLSWEFTVKKTAYLWRGIQRQSFMVSGVEVFLTIWNEVDEGAGCERCHQDCCCPVSVFPLFLFLQVWSLEQPDWHCKIDEGSIGLVSSRWSPDGRHILNTTEFHVSVKLVCACVRAFMPMECVYTYACLVSTVAGRQVRGSWK